MMDGFAFKYSRNKFMGKESSKIGKRNACWGFTLPVYLYVCLLMKDK